MEIRNCPLCGKLFSDAGKGICPQCVVKDEEIFKTLKEYIDENPKMSKAYVSEETGVSPGRISRYVKEGRLIVSEGMAEDFACENCGKPVSTGRYCKACLRELNKGLDAALSDESERADKYAEASDARGYLKKKWSE
ncbi:MAG: winged helix-turn-helix transcriptional regulator [Clostridiales bacterium]|jgi:flagellar operon protein (TIGR03826 family)|nr:winged helix-turn-helix transcriptional regulator [Clostridiales bacterium]